MTALSRPLHAPTAVGGTGRARGKARRLWFWALIAPVIALALALGLRAFVVVPYHVPSGSMTPAVLPGDVVLANRLAYVKAGAERGPERGDVVVFRGSMDGAVYVKRVIGLPGDEVALRGGAVVINGEAAAIKDLGAYAARDARGRPLTVMARSETLPDGVRVEVHHQTYGPGRETGIDDYPPTLVPEGQYFVLGDNRDASFDSRWPELVGLVERENIVGRVDRVMVSFTPQFRWADPRTWGQIRSHRIGRGL